MNIKINPKPGIGSARKTLKKLLIYLVPHRMRIVVLFIILIIETVLKILAPLVFGNIINILWAIVRGSPGAAGGFTKIMANTGLLLLFYAGIWLCESGVSRTAGVMGNMILYKLRCDIFTKLQYFSLRFFSRYNSGEIMSRLMNDTDAINSAINTVTTNFFRHLFFLTGIVITMTLLNAKLTAVTSVILVLMAVSTVFFTGKIKNAYRRTRETISNINSELVEDISGVKVSQAFNRQKENMHNFKQVNRKNRNASIRIAFLYSIIYPVYNVINSIGTAITLVFGGYLFLQHSVTPGIVITFVQYIDKFFYPVKSLSSVWYDIQAGIAAGEHIFGFLDTCEVIPVAPSPVILPGIKGKVEFRDVCFEYIQNRQVLNHISFQVLPGKKIAIVGPTGSGKTTLLNLLLRFYDVSRGAVLIDDHDVCQLSLKSLRSGIGIVLQDTHLFSQTIMDNIRYARLDAADNEVIQAAKQANAHEFISRLPQGYATEIQEGGSNLSRGQRQLISIARAILSNPAILILDEATSSVDTKTELLIQDALKTLLNYRTSFIVTHRLSTIKNADHILVLNGGAIVEQGTHEQLLAQKGEYYNSYRAVFCNGKN